MDRGKRRAKARLHFAPFMELKCRRVKRASTCGAQRLTSTLNRSSHGQWMGAASSLRKLSRSLGDGEWEARIAGPKCHGPRPGASAGIGSSTDNQHSSVHPGDRRDG